MPTSTSELRRAPRRVLAKLDAGFNRLYTWRANPLYHSGALVVAAFLVLLLTGLYLLLFYRIGSPYASVAGITGQVWLGRWVRTLHRYASDLAMIAAAIHALRMLLQGRSWGPRALAWISGLALAFVFLVCGWTGYVMVWDAQAQILAEEGARLLDFLPLFSEPVGRAFVGAQDLPAAFFFLNLFLHIALPIGVALLLYIHVSRLARPALLPPRRLLWGSIGVLTVLSVGWPVLMGAEASAFILPQGVPLDVFYGFWLPVTSRLPAWGAWAAAATIAGVAVSVPWWTRPRQGDVPLASVVNERFCTGCEQCAQDCPYEAITMVTRADGRAELVARVDPARCVSCGICAGSCAPMGVGPPGRTGRDQLDWVKAFVQAHGVGPEDIVVLACERSGGNLDTRYPCLPVACAGSAHTSVIEYLIRSGAGGVLVVSCPPRDCWNREGVRWLDQRMYHDREAELQERVDRRRVRVVHAGEAEPEVVRSAIDVFAESIRTLAPAASEASIGIDTECDTPTGQLEPAGGPS